MEQAAAAYPATLLSFRGFGFGGLRQIEDLLPGKPRFTRKVAVWSERCQCEHCAIKPRKGRIAQKKSDMNEQLDPYIELFRARAEKLDAEGAPSDSDELLVILASLIGNEEGALSEHAMNVLTEIGGQLYREGLRRKLDRLADK